MSKEILTVVVRTHGNVKKAAVVIMDIGGTNIWDLFVVEYRVEFGSEKGGWFPLFLLSVFNNQVAVIVI